MIHFTIKDKINTVTLIALKLLSVARINNKSGKLVQGGTGGSWWADIVTELFIM